MIMITLSILCLSLLGCYLATPKSLYYLIFQVKFKSPFFKKKLLQLHFHHSNLNSIRKLYKVIRRI